MWHPSQATLWDHVCFHLCPDWIWSLLPLWRTLRSCSWPSHLALQGLIISVAPGLMCSSLNSVPSTPQCFSPCLCLRVIPHLDPEEDNPIWWLTQICNDSWNLAQQSDLPQRMKKKICYNWRFSKECAPSPEGHCQRAALREHSFPRGPLSKAWHAFLESQALACLLKKIFTVPVATLHAELFCPCQLSSRKQDWICCFLALFEPCFPLSTPISGRLPHFTRIWSGRLGGSPVIFENVLCGSCSSFLHKLRKGIHTPQDGEKWSCICWRPGIPEALASVRRLWLLLILNN